MNGSPGYHFYEGRDGGTFLQVGGGGVMTSDLKWGRYRGDILPPSLEGKPPSLAD